MLTAESRAMVGTNAALMAFAIMSVVLRFQVRGPEAFCLQLDDYMILTALVRLSHQCDMKPSLIRPVSSSSL